MRCKTPFLLFLAQTIAIFTAEEVDIAILSRYSSYFTTRENMQLKGEVVKRFDSPCLSSCSGPAMHEKRVVYL